MNNPILNKIIEDRNGHYCHCVEVSTVYELECIVESIVGEYGDDYSFNELLEFFQTLEVYCLDDSQEDETYNFNFKESLTYII